MRKLNVTENLVGFPLGETLNLQVRTWVVDARRIEGLRAQGVGWKAISREMGIGVGTLYRLARDGMSVAQAKVE